MSPYMLTTSPSFVASPTTPDDVARTVAEASAAGQALVPWGGGTRQHLGNHPARYDGVLVTTGLKRIIEYSPADLVITVEAGVTLATIQQTLAAHGQWLPWDVHRADEATVGGLLASNSVGPLRLGYGTPRDWTLGMRVVLGDGRIVKSGAKVVKNVAGYDTHKLHIGALGTLGIIVEITFKVAPLPTSETTLVAQYASQHDALAAANALYQPPLSPVSLVVLDGGAAQRIGHTVPFVVIARYVGVAAAVERQQREAQTRSRAHTTGQHTLAENESRALWNTLTTLAYPIAHDRHLLRVGARPSALPTLLEAIAANPHTEATMALVGTGIAYTHWRTPLAEAELTTLRQQLAASGGYAVVEAGDAALASQARWGDPPRTLPLMQRLKTQWDAYGCLNPGRFLV